MEYMESKMQDLMEASNAEYEHLLTVQQDFERWFLTIPDVDESLILDKLDHGLNYKNHDVERMWFAFKGGYGAGYAADV